MPAPGTRILMTKGYKGIQGVILERTDSPFEFYVVRLKNDIHIVVGPSAFVLDDEGGQQGPDHME